MVALDNMALFGHGGTLRLRKMVPPLAAGIALVAAALVLGAVLARDFSENGFRLASRLAWRYACLVFFLALIAGPICRIGLRFLPGTKFPNGLGRELVWGFCASYGIYLLSVFLPNVIHQSAGATLMVLFGGGVVLVMALTVASPERWANRPSVEKARRGMLGAAVLYFWLCYAVMALARLAGPHRPDAFYGISLCLMVVGLLTRYADRWFSGPSRNVSNLRQLPETAPKPAPN